MLFIKLNLRIKSGYHPADTQANSETIINIDRIDYRCTESVDEIKEKIMLAEIADNLA